MMLPCFAYAASNHFTPPPKARVESNTHLDVNANQPSRSTSSGRKHFPTLHYLVTNTTYWSDWLNYVWLSNTTAFKNMI